MKRLIYLSILFLFNIGHAQDLINTYNNLDQHPLTDLVRDNGGNYTFIGYNPASWTISPYYEGEYEINLKNFYWGNNALLPFYPGNVAENFTKTWQIECVSFPFTKACAFTNFGCENPLDNTRNLEMPDENSFFIDSWTYPFISTFNQNKLAQKTEENPFLAERYSNLPSSGGNTLVTFAFNSNAGIGSSRTILPHSILKHTCKLYCENDLNSPHLAEISWVNDLTRSRLREYPFTDANVGGSIVTYDLVTVPTLTPPFSNGGFAYYGAGNNCNQYGENDPAYNDCSIQGYRGGTINYFNFDYGVDDFCSLLSSTYQDVSSPSDPFAASGSTEYFSNLPISNYSLVSNTHIKNNAGTLPAGYQINSNGTIEKINANPIKLNFFINKNINLNLINPSERIIYNPSEIEVTASNLIFPTNYVFKTFRATYPYYDEVMAANTAANGCDGNTLLKNVPVITDLRYEGTDPKYNASDPWFSAIYRLHAGSKITIENCVKLFDCTFDLLPNSKIVFQNYATNQVNVDRYKVLLNGGVYSRGRHDWVFQNKMETDKVLEFFSDNEILAGKDVDLLQPAGDYVVMPSANVSFISKTSVRLLPGFEAREGCQFLAAIDPSVVIPDCSFSPLRTSGNQRPEAGLNFIPPHKGERVPAVLNLVCEPNPATDMVNLTVQLNIPDKVTISIFNPQMQVVKQVGNEWWQGDASFTYSIGLENLSSGVYYCSVKGSISQKIVKLIKL
ncbi:MAG: Secretion system C-terminal sorting domain [Bacteroidota bacterium]|jgi:hypothetical protein